MSAPPREQPVRVAGQSAARSLRALRERLLIETLEGDEDGRVAIRDLLEECREFMRGVGPLLAHHAIRMDMMQQNPALSSPSRGFQATSADPAMVEKAKLELAANAISSLVPDPEAAGASLPSMLQSVSDSGSFQSFAEPSYEGFPQRHNVKILKQKKPQHMHDSRYGVRGGSKPGGAKMKYIPPRQALVTKKRPPKVHLKTPYPFYSGTPSFDEDMLYKSGAAQQTRYRQRHGDPLTGPLSGEQKTPMERIDRGLYGLHNMATGGGQKSKREEALLKKEEEAHAARVQAEEQKRATMQKKMDDARNRAREEREAREAEEQRQREEEERNERRIERIKQMREDLDKTREEDADFVTFLRGES